MANSLGDTINFITPFCRYQAANVGASNMPIVGIASIVRNIILAAPFTWRFNRNSVNLTGPVTQGQQDYTQTINDFGFLEKASALDTDGTYWEFKDIYNNQPLSFSTTLARPQAIAVQNDNGSNSFTFRLSAVPDQAYTINLTYQKAPVQFTTTSDFWGPVPDSFSDVYNNLSLGYYMDSCQDPRAPQYIARGIAGLLARSTGLSQMDKAVFAQSYMSLDATHLLNTLKTQQGIQAQAAR